MLIWSFKKKKKIILLPPLTLCPNSVPANSNMKGDDHAKCGCDNISVNNKREWKMENVGMVENVLISHKWKMFLAFLSYFPLISEKVLCWPKYSIIWYLVKQMEHYKIWLGHKAMYQTFPIIIQTNYRFESLILNFNIHQDTFQWFNNNNLIYILY